MLNLLAPYSQEAEEAVIGAVLINPSAFVTVCSFLKADDFFFVRHQYIWQAMNVLNERREPVDYLTLVDTLRIAGRLAEIGGAAFLTTLINATPTSVHAEVYGRLVERASTRRRLMIAADEIKQLALNEAMTIETVTAEAESRLFKVTDRSADDRMHNFGDLISTVSDGVEARISGNLTDMGVPSGLRELDGLIGGWQKGDLVIFAGRPGMGKSSALATFSLNAARLGARVALFSLEMGGEMVTQRLLAMETGINTQTMRLGKLSPQEWSRFVEAAGRLSNFPIFIDDTPGLSVQQLRAKCRHLVHQHGLDLIIVDYVQLMTGLPEHRNNRVLEIGYITQALKELARELNVPVIAAAQLNRAVEQRQDKRPVLSDLRESGNLENDADIVIFLYRDVVYNPNTEFPNAADMIVAKHRNGATDTVSLYYEKTITKFMDGAIRRIDLGNLEPEDEHENELETAHPW